MAIEKLSAGQLDEELSKLNAPLEELWSLREGKLHKEFRFADFVAAFGFMAQAALLAERQGHHPEWRNVYNRVSVELSTHEAGGVSARDFELAAAMEALFA